MVSVAKDIPLTEAGTPDSAAWSASLKTRQVDLDIAVIDQCCHQIAETAPELLAQGMELAEIMLALEMDQPAVIAALSLPWQAQSPTLRDEAVACIGVDAYQLTESVVAMANISLLTMADAPLLDSERESQVENIKRMLVAMIDDARVAVIKLAERVIALRRAKQASHEVRRDMAQEIASVYAPLADRLGIWQLKWELEDLSLRYLREDIYMGIARQLTARRTEREAQIEALKVEVKGLLARQSITAEIQGRAKNIFSIWRKMQSKGIAIGEVYDARAVRIVVKDLADCYAALGVVHTRWQHIPHEFDDYIAMPKENGYRSIHTAVTMDDGQTLEIQIRTEVMHYEAELGVCAHWVYKDRHGQTRQEDKAYAAKMDWLRQVMEWHEEANGFEALGDLLQRRVVEDRVFVTTPDGHVVAMAEGSTILDFAYRVHTELGNRCIGGRVNGVVKSLREPLTTGQQVVVLTDAEQVPQRFWAETSLGILQTHRARSKVLAYFRTLTVTQKISVGRDVVQDLLVRAALWEAFQAPLDELIRAVFDIQTDVFYAQIGSAERSAVAAVVGLLTNSGRPESRLGEATSISIYAVNRDGLLNNVTQAVSINHLSLLATSATTTQPPTHAEITITVQFGDWLGFFVLLDYICGIEGVIDAHRMVE